MKNSIDTKTLLQKAEEFAMLGHWQLDLETEELYWSEQIYRIHGVDPQDFIPNVEDGISFYYPDDREIVRYAVERAINEGTPFDVELRIIRRDGEVRYIRSRGEVEVDNVGVKKTLFGVFQDITENKMKQFELEEKEDFLETMMETLPDILFVKDENYKIVRANNNFISLYPEEQRDKIIGYTTIEHYQPEDRDEFLKMDRLAFETGFSNTEETINFPDGSRRTFITKKVRFNDAKGEKFILAIATDISDFKAAQKKIIEANEDLEDFAYITSHDLKEPLCGIHNYAEFVLEDCKEKLDTDDVDKLNTIVRLSKRLETLIGALLEYSRVGRGEPNIQDIDIKDLVSGVLDDLSYQMQNQNAHVTLDENLPHVSCDPVSTGEIFRNLITNAMKYNDAGSKQIEIGTVTDYAGHKGRPVFYVRDNGIGIKKSNLDSVFKIFKRLHGRDEYGGGTGSGLTIVQKLVKRHGGDIWIESEVGQGTTFFFTLSGS